MLVKFKSIIKTDFPYLKKGKILLAISGGIDSVVLAYLLHTLKMKVEFAHCNFSLRGIDSNKDETFVIELAKQLKIPIHTTKFNTKEYAKINRLSIQEAARNLRYHWFNTLAEEKNYSYVLTAHHLDDNIETFFINISRGTGLDGLTGIPSKNKNIVRPLLSFTRAEILQYAKDNKLTWREDASNKDKKYLRNKIRHQITPILKEINPNITNAFQLTFQHLQASKQLVENEIKSILKDVQTVDLKNDCLKFNVSKLTELNPLSTYLYEIFKPYGFTNTKDLEAILHAQSGKQLFSKTYRLIKDREFILLSKIKEEKNNIYSINEDVTKLKLDLFALDFSCNKTTKETIDFDKDLLKFPLTVRKWQKGDYFYPIGLQGKKKLSKYFKDEKLSLLEKENIWLLLSNNQIVWVIGKRQDNRFKITNQTKNTYNISIPYEENY